MNSLKDVIFAIYSYLTPTDGVSAYYIIDLFDETGTLDHDFLVEIYEEMFNSVPTISHIGPFQSLEDIDKYAFKVCDQLSADKVTIISTEEYNTMIVDVSDTNELKSRILVVGNTLDNPDSKKKKGFFGKIFN